MTGRKPERARELLKAAAKYYGLSTFDFVSQKDSLDWQSNMDAIVAIADGKAAP